MLQAKQWLVEVAVPVPLRQTFTYQVPPDMNGDQVKQGYRVLVPFRARLRHGITMSDAYQVEEVGEKIRMLNSYDHRQRLLTSEINNLLKWLVAYYRVPIGEAVKLALPTGTLHEREFLFKLTAEGEDQVRNLAELRVLGLLSGKPLEKKQWEALAQAKISWGQVRDWEKAGYLEMVASGKNRESLPHTTVIELSPAGGAQDLATLSRSPKQQELLRWLRNHAQTMVETREANEVFKGASSLLTKLEERGLCKRRSIPKYELDMLVETFEPDEHKLLTSEQDVALKQIVEDLDSSQYHANLIFGVTGAGKTEVYLRAIQHCLKQGRQALFLVPEIGLTPLMQRRIVDRFGNRLAILHSAVGNARRTASWAQVLAGKIDVVLGARSGVFAPLPRLGLIIVDEEHDHSYKQNDGIRYQARDLALVRAHEAKAVVVLGSATPSQESWQNCMATKCHLLTIKKRATNALLPEVAIVDMRKEFKEQRRRPLLSNTLAEQLEMTLGAGHQAMILINRRGYHSFLLCRKCGEAIGCSQCEVSLTYHKTDRTLKCHYCGETRREPINCPYCEAPNTQMQYLGEGTQQVQEYIQKLFPQYKVDRLDRDRLSATETVAKILGEFDRRKSHILVGTQMIAKGHDFPNVTLVGIINADQGLRCPDFRAAEITYQLIAQVAGRSGRGENPGKVVVQTYMPDHYSITSAANHDFQSFQKREMRYRQSMFYMPFAHMVALLVTHQDMDHALSVTTWMAEQLRGLAGQSGVVVLGPARAPIGRIKGAWRYQIVVKSAKRGHLHQTCDAVTEEVVKRKMLPRQAIILDIDPYQFY